VVFSLQRDRIVRVWETGGCVASITVAPSPSTALSRAVPILDADPRRLLQVLPPEDIFTDDGLRLLVFMPSSTGGYFSVLSLSAKNSGGLRSLQLIGTKECSEQSRNRHFRDYMVTNGILWVLWDDEGNPALEYTELDAEDDDQAPWKSVSPAPGIDFSPTYFEDHLFNHRSFAGVFLSTLLRPGLFSKYTLRAALQQYSTVLSSLQGSHTRLLTATYDSLTEHIAAVVGSTVTLGLDPQTGEQLWNPYWNALKRDWEGFVARCREIERNARWPLSLGLTSHGEPFVVERERLSAVVVTDRAMQFYETTKALPIAVDVDPGAPDIFSLIQLAFSIRSYFNPLQSITIDQAILDLSREESPLPYLDRAAQFSNRHITNILTVEAISWLEQNLDKILDLEATVGDILNILTGLDAVKLEEDDPDVIGTPQMPWQTGLTTAYITSTIQYRQALTLQIFALLAFIADVRPHTISSEPSVIGQALAAIQCISALQHVSTWPAGDPEAVFASFAEDDVASLMQSMHVSGNSTNNRYGPTYSLLHLLLIPTASFPLGRTSYISPSVSAHQFLSANGLLRTRAMPTVEMSEVQFLNQILKLGQGEVAREMLEWFPRSPAITYLLGRALLDCGRSDDAATLLERVEHSVGGFHVTRGNFLPL
jgi:nuclear pore complex protein Nup160